ncbi:MAG: 2-keto-4-pentenoate hydratase [Paracoccaceae bacterium]
MTRLAFSALFGALLAAPGLAQACATDAQIADYLDAWSEKRPAAALVPDGTMEDALCTQGKLVGSLSRVMGRPVGFKAGLTSEAAQARFGAEEPLMGMLFEQMLLPDGAEVPADFGVRPLFEADLLLIVDNPGINDAKTVEEALLHISEIRPFIELPDIMMAEGEPVTAVTLTANNVATRLGVVGEAINVRQMRASGFDLVEGLREMTVRVEAADGEVLASSKGEVVLGHPVQSLLWLLEQGVTLNEGALVSVGSIGPLLPPAKAKGAVRVVYEGIPGTPTVSLTFTD